MRGMSLRGDGRAGNEPEGKLCMSESACGTRLTGMSKRGKLVVGMLHCEGNRSIENRLGGRSRHTAHRPASKHAVVAIIVPVSGQRPSRLASSAVSVCNFQ